MVILWATEFIGKFYAVQTQLAKAHVLGNGIYRKRNDTYDITIYKYN